MKTGSIYKLSLAISLTFVAAACMRVEYDGDAPPAALFPATFPTELTAKAVGDCESGTLGYTTMIASGILLYKAGDAPISAQMQVEVNANGNYLAVYREFDASGEIFNQSLNGSVSYNPQNGGVALSNFGSGSLDYEFGHYVLNIVPTRVLNTSLLTRRTIEFHGYKGFDDLSGSRAQACATPTPTPTP